MKPAPVQLTAEQALGWGVVLDPLDRAFADPSDPERFPVVYRGWSAPAPDPDPAALLTDADVDAMVERWADPRAPLSDHTVRAITYLHQQRTRGRPAVLAEGTPVPGCVCADCTGLPNDHPARLGLQKPARTPRRTRQAATGHSPHPQPAGNRATLAAVAPERERLDVDRARAVPLLDVCEMLGIKLGRRAGRTYRIPCPAHRGDGPNCAIDPVRGLWKCFTCDEGGDGLRMVERVRGVSFVDAVRFLIG